VLGLITGAAVAQREAGIGVAVGAEQRVAEAVDDGSLGCGYIG